ncbi:MAG TPA: LuxR C-terminal-related transcriptional regulator [Thermoanaerobaculia bacterium]|jgi:DNA-binding NarL/FixJ family response regulator
MLEQRRVLLLEPDVWRFTGIAQFLSDRGIDVLGAFRNDQLVFSSDSSIAPPDTVMLAHLLVVQHGPALVRRIRSSYPGAAILVHGEARCIKATAALLALGVKGYYVLSDPQSHLLQALTIVGRNGIWAPREAVALLAHSTVVDSKRVAGSEGSDRIVLKMLSDGLSNKEIAGRLGIAEVTVKTRLTRLYKRHSVRTRLQLLSCAIRQHLIDE